MPARRRYQSQSLGDPIGLYSHGFVSSGTQRTLYVAGQLSVGAGQKSVGQGNFDEQFHQVFANFGAVLEAAEMTFARPV